MIFYLATETTGRKVLFGTQVDAKKLDKNYGQIDVPVDKKGLMEAIQETLDMVFALEGKVNSAAHDASIAPVTIDLNPAPADSFKDRANESREAERAEFMSVSRDVLSLSDKILTLDGWPLGQIAAAVTSRIAELAKPYVEAPTPAENGDEDAIQAANEAQDHG